MSRGAGRGTILIVPILLLLAAAVILAGVVSVAMGHGGEMAEFATDHLPPDLATAADVALLQLALHGYTRMRGWEDSEWPFQGERALRTLGIPAEQLDAILDEALASFEVLH